MELASIDHKRNVVQRSQVPKAIATMKLTIVLATLLVTASTSAGADCTNNRLNGSAAERLLNDKLVCAQRVGTTDALNRWSEVHRAPAGAPNNLDEWARGPSDPVDPSRIGVGTWSRNGGNIAYEYTNDSGGPYEYQLYGVGTSPFTEVSFCDGPTEVAQATLVSSPSGANPCTWPN
jgi:hypothetical protein